MEAVSAHGLYCVSYKSTYWKKTWSAFCLLWLLGSYHERHCATVAGNKWNNRLQAIDDALANVMHVQKSPKDPGQRKSVKQADKKSQELAKEKAERAANQLLAMEAQEKARAHKQNEKKKQKATSQGYFLTEVSNLKVIPVRVPPAIHCWWLCPCPVHISFSQAELGHHPKYVWFDPLLRTSPTQCFQWFLPFTLLGSSCTNCRFTELYSTGHQDCCIQRASFQCYSWTKLPHNVLANTFISKYRSASWQHKVQLYVTCHT